MTETVLQDESFSKDVTALRTELDVLLRKYKIDENFVVDNVDLAMVVGALSATDIESVYVDEENGLVIEYTGNE